MAIKHKIKFKKQIEEKKEDLHERDRPRYEEQSEEYRRINDHSTLE